MKKRTVYFWGDFHQFSSDSSQLDNPLDIEKESKKGLNVEGYWGLSTFWCVT